MCDCQSYNLPELGGHTQEVILPKPDWSSKTQGICVDACISEAILMLWSHGIITGGCCCGHNRENPSVVLEDTVSENDAQKAIALLERNDGRIWEVMRWRLVTIEKQE